MNLIATLLMELLGMAPTLVQDVEGTISALHSSPDAAAKALQISQGIDHLVEHVQPLLKSVGK